MGDRMSVALKAAELLEHKGWKQGTYEAKSGCMCIFGALITVAVPAHPFHAEDPLQWDSWYLRQQQMNKEHKDVVAAVRKSIEETGWVFQTREEIARLTETYGIATMIAIQEELLEDNQAYIVRWNDETGRTQEEVVAVLKRADEILEGK
jgi:hypothetical protein